MLDKLRRCLAALERNPAPISAGCHQRLHARYKLGRLEIAPRPDQVAYLGYELVHVWVFRREPGERGAEPQLVLEIGWALPLGLDGSGDIVKAGTNSARAHRLRNPLSARPQE